MKETKKRWIKKKMGKEESGVRREMEKGRRDRKRDTTQIIRSAQDPLGKGEICKLWGSRIPICSWRPQCRGQSLDPALPPTMAGPRELWGQMEG